MTNLITAHHLHKYYGNIHALNDISFSVDRGQIIGLLGQNGAGKSTLINAILGLANVAGELTVLEQNPRYKRTQLLKKLCFISDVAILPSWLKVSEAIIFLKGVHPLFSRSKALEFLAKTEIPLTARVKTLSKGMVTQLHLALIMAIDAEILVLDEPTLGLDILYRKHFYSTLVNDYYTQNRTILITTHQAEEIESLITHLMILDHGRSLLHTDMETLNQQYITVEASPQMQAKLLALEPLHEQVLIGKNLFLFKDRSRHELEPLGSLSRPSISDIFVATVTGRAS